MKVHDELLSIDSQLKMPLMKLPIKMILVRLQTGVVMISPIPNLQQFKGEIDQFGKVTDIVAPNLYHNLGIKDATETYPQARLWGAKGYRKKLPNQNWYKEIDSQNWIHAENLPLFPIDGMPKINEVDFIHKNSKTLIVTDLCFNHRDGKGFGNWIIFNMFGTYKRFAISKLFLKMVKDKKAFAESIQNILATDFDNIIVSHGVNIIGNGKEIFKRAAAERSII